MLNQMKARKWVLSKHFEGLPKRSDLEIQEEDIPALKDEEFLAEAVYLSVDPYMRYVINSFTWNIRVISQYNAEHSL